MIKYKQLSQEQRYVIGRLLNAGNTQEGIAREVGCLKYTISRVVQLIKHRAELLGYHFEGEELNTLYENFLIVVDEKGSVYNEDLQVLVGSMPVLER
jgi:hypothetical protein